MYIPAWPSLNPADFVKPDRGGELPFPLDSSSKTFFYVARNGIYHLARALGLERGATVLAPDYHHGNEIHALRAAGARIKYYPVNKNLEVDLNVVAKLCAGGPRVLYVTHYLGWPQPMAELQAFCRERRIVLVEDCALAFMSHYDGKPLGTFGDYSVFCLYKSVPLPNGGVLVRNNSGAKPLDKLELKRCSGLSVAGRSTELMLQWIRLRYETCGHALFGLKRMAGQALSTCRLSRTPVGDTGFDLCRVNAAMSPICHTLLRRFHYDSIKESRRRNFTLLQERLRGKVSLLEKNLGDGVCPLFFPLFVSDKHRAAQTLWRRGIETIEFWNSGDPEAQDEGSDADFLRRHMLEVPIHQDVTLGAVDYMAEQIIKLGVGLPA